MLSFVSLIDHSLVAYLAHTYRTVPNLVPRHLMSIPFDNIN